MTLKAPAPLRKLRALGQSQIDALDSLRALGRATFAQLVEHTGRRGSHFRAAVGRLRAVKLVGRRRAYETKRGAGPFVYWLTAAGRRELELRERIGRPAGVPNAATHGTVRLARGWEGQFTRGRYALILRQLRPETERSTTEIANAIGKQGRHVARLLGQLEKYGYATGRAQEQKGRGKGSRPKVWKMTVKGALARCEHAP